MPRLTRRNFLVLGATSLAALAVTGCAGQGADSNPNPTAGAPPLQTRNLLLVGRAGQSDDGRGAFTAAAIGLDASRQEPLQPLIALLAGRRYSDLSGQEQQQFLNLLAAAQGFTVFFQTFPGGTRFTERTAHVAARAAQLLGGTSLDLHLDGGSELRARTRERLMSRRVPFRRIRSSTTGRVLVADAMASILSRAFRGAGPEQAVVQARADLFQAL